jgi:multiple sugar transport system substrate-binding protein
MFRKRMFSLMAVIVITSLVLAACGAPAATPAPADTQAPAAPATQAPAASSGEAVTITFWHGFNAHEVDFLNQIIEKYWTPTHPNIKVVTAGNKSNDDILTAMSGGDAPDVVMAGSPEVLSLWASQGAIVDLTDSIAPMKSDLEAQQVPAGLQWVMYQGKYYGLPFVNFNWGLFYNKDLFKDAGLDPEKPPKTLDELADYAKKLTKVDSSGSITQLGWMPLNDPWRALNFVLNSGGKFYDASTGAPTFNDPNTVKAFQWDIDLQKTYGMDKVTAFTTGFTQGDNPFQLGKVAMYIDGCWNPEFFKLNAPNLHYGVAAIPYSDAKYANANNLGTNPIVVPTASKHQKEAIEFAIFFAMNKDIAREFSAEISNIPQIKSELSTFTTNADTKFFADLSASPNAVAWAPVPYSQKYLDEMTSAIGDMYNKGVAPKDALDAAQKIVEQAAQEYLKK